MRVLVIGFTDSDAGDGGVGSGGWVSRDATSMWSSIWWHYGAVAAHRVIIPASDCYAQVGRPRTKEIWDGIRMAIRLHIRQMRAQCQGRRQRPARIPSYTRWERGLRPARSCHNVGMRAHLWHTMWIPPLAINQDMSIQLYCRTITAQGS